MVNRSVRVAPGTSPVTRWAWVRAEQHLAWELPRRWAHVRGVADQATLVGGLMLAGRELDLLVATALLHDIGYARGLVDTGFHPLDGARYITSEGGSARLANLVANHSAAVFEAEIRGLASELAKYPDERTVLRDLLWYCDQRTGAMGERMTFDERIAGVRDRHGPDSLVVGGLDAGGLTARREAFVRTQLRLREVRMTGRRTADRVPRQERRVAR
jgi:hypothetical protein